jgi:hypothetical protein
MVVDLGRLLLDRIRKCYYYDWQFISVGSFISMSKIQVVVTTPQGKAYEWKEPEELFLGTFLKLSNKYTFYVLCTNVLSLVLLFGFIVLWSVTHQTTWAILMLIFSTINILLLVFVGFLKHVFGVQTKHLRDYMELMRPHRRNSFSSNSSSSE